MEHFQVIVKRKVERGLRKLPENIRDKFFILAEQLRKKGPIAPNWQNYKALGNNRYHCHLAYHWVACWYHDKGTVIIEVY